MCEGFGLIVTRDAAYFIEPDSDGDVSHSDILERLGWKENDDNFLRGFVRVEYPDWTEASFRFDEDATLPGWADSDDVIQRCHDALRKCAPARAEYEKVRPALAECEKVCAQALAEYEKVRDTAWAECEKVCAQARAECEKVCAQAWDEYVKVCDTAWDECVKVCVPAWAEMIAKLTLIPGYCA